MIRCLSFILLLLVTLPATAQTSSVVHFVCLSVEGDGYKLTISRGPPTSAEIAHVVPSAKRGTVKALVLIEGAFDQRPYGAGYSTVALSDFLDGKTDVFPIVLTQLPPGEKPEVNYQLHRSTVRKIAVLEWRLGDGPVVVYSAMKAD
ncbi:MAG: hypothetical protein WCG80_10470 [Spirochaetales bacterium]